MSSKKAYQYLLVVFCLALITVALLVKSANSIFVASNSSLQSVRKEVAELEAERDGLAKAEKILATKGFDKETLSKAIPTDKDQAHIIKELYAIADGANVTIDSVGFPASSLGSQAAASPQAGTGGTSTNSSSSSSSSGTAAQAQKPTQVISQATPLKNVPGVQSIQVDLGAIRSKTLPADSKGIRYDEMIAFIRELEHNKRTVQIRSIGITPSTAENGEKTYSLTLMLNIFIRA